MAVPSGCVVGDVGDVAIPQVRNESDVDVR